MPVANRIDYNFKLVVPLSVTQQRGNVPLFPFIVCLVLTCLKLSCFLSKKSHNNGAAFNALVQPSHVIIFINQHKEIKLMQQHYYAAFVRLNFFGEKLEKLLMMPF